MKLLKNKFSNRDRSKNENHEKESKSRYTDILYHAIWALSNMMATPQVAIHVINLTSGDIIKQMLNFVKCVESTEINTAYTNLINEASYFMCTLISESSSDVQA